MFYNLKFTYLYRFSSEIEILKDINFHKNTYA